MQHIYDVNTLVYHCSRWRIMTRFKCFFLNLDRLLSVSC